MGTMVKVIIPGGMNVDKERFMLGMKSLTYAYIMIRNKSDIPKEVYHMIDSRLSPLLFFMVNMGVNRRQVLINFNKIIRCVLKGKRAEICFNIL